MDKEQTLTLLRAKFAGVNDSVLGRIAEKLAKTATTSEKAEAAVEALTIQQIIDSYSDSRATEATQTAVHNYEARYGLKDGKILEKGISDKTSTDDAGVGGTRRQNAKEDKTGGAEIPEWAKVIIDSNKELADQLNTLKAERTTNGRKAQIDGIVGKLPAEIQKSYRHVTVDRLSDDDFKKLVDEITTEVGEINSSLTRKGAIFGRPSATHGGQATQGAGELTKEQQEAIARREGKIAEGQPF